MRATPQCEQAIEHAREASARLGHASVSSGHLVLGLLMVGRGVAEMLGSFGLTREATERHLTTYPLRTEGTQQKGDILFGTSAVLVMDRAEHERKSGPPRNRFVGTDHLLLAICHEEAGDAYDLFEAYHVDRAETRRLLLERLAKPWPPDFESLIDKIESQLNEIENRKD